MKKNPQTMRTTRAARLVIAIILAGLGCETKAADDIFDLPIESLMQMSVSIASPFTESVMESASSVSVIQSADWELRGARSLEDVLEMAPSVVAYSSLGGASMFAIRGYANDISTRGTAMLLDGVPLNNYSYATAAYSLPFMALPQLQRLEMIRGPGSTLYGSDAFHGVMSLSTWEPAQQQRNVKLSAGVPRQLQSAANWAAKSSAFSANGGVAWTDYGDRDTTYRYIDPVTGAPGYGTWDNNETSASGYLHLEHGTLDGGRWRVGFYADRYRSSDFPNVGTQFTRPLLAVNPVSADYLRDHDQMGQESDFLLAQTRYERRLGETLSLDVHAFGWQSDQQWILDITGYPDAAEVVSLGFPGGCQEAVPAPGWPLHCPHWQYQGTRESRAGLHLLLRDDRAAGTSWAVGGGTDLYTIAEAFVQRIGVDGSTYVDVASPFEGEDRHIEHLLVQGRTKSGAWTTFYGLRWDDYSDIGAAFSPRAALVFRRPGRDWAAKLQYGRAFRAPSAVEQYGSGDGTQQLPSPALDLETLDTVELVWQMQGESSDSEIVAFGSRWQDGIVLAPVGGGVNQYQNSGRNSAHGIEFTHRRAFGAWRVEGNLSWASSENDRTGIDYVGYPAYLASLGLSRQLGAGMEIGVAGRAMIDMAMGDALGADIPPDAPDYYRVDLHGAWRRGELRCALDVRNLFNRDNIVPSMLNARSGSPDPETDIVLSVALGY